MEKSLWDTYIKATHLKWLGEIDAWTKLDITMTQFKVLMILSHSKEMSISQLADMLGVSLPNINGIIDRLIQQEYLSKNKSDKDGRIINIMLTEIANNKILNIEQSGKENFNKIVGDLTDTEKEIINLGLKVLIKAFEKK